MVNRVLLASLVRPSVGGAVGGAASLLSMIVSRYRSVQLYLRILKLKDKYTTKCFKRSSVSAMTVSLIVFERRFRYAAKKENYLV